MTVPKHEQAAATVRARIADGTLRPGAAAPSGAALARDSGCAVLTARRALRTLIEDGTLIPGPSRNARPRVPGPDSQTPNRQDLARARRELSAALAGRRRAAGLTQHELAALAGFSVTAVCHAETGRLRQSRRFWEQADKALCACGELLRLYDAYRAAAPPPAEQTGDSTGSAAPVPSPALDSIMLVWSDGTITTVRPPIASLPP
jgi:DNA-binding transcriptional regulator YhcF (GntR family)